MIVSLHRRLSGLFTGYSIQLEIGGCRLKRQAAALF